MKYLIALVALGCVVIGIVAFAQPRTAIKGGSATKPKVKSQHADASVVKKLRVYTKQDLTTQTGQLAWKQFSTLSADGAQADRLEMIRKEFPQYQLSATSWTITFNKVTQKEDGVHVELEVIPSLVADRQPASIVNGKMIETWVIKKNGDRTECRCHVRNFDKPVGLAIF